VCEVGDITICTLKCILRDREEGRKKERNRIKGRKMKEKRGANRVVLVSYYTQ
jgi:hypothetical protein